MLLLYYYFSSFVIINIIMVFWRILLKSYITRFELSVKLEDAYFVKKNLMVAFGILAYSEIYNPL